MVNLIQSWMDGRTPPHDPLWVYTTGSPNEAERGMTRLQLRNSFIFYRVSGDNKLCWYHARRGSPKFDNGTWDPPNYRMKFGVKSWGIFVDDPWIGMIMPRGIDSALTWHGKVKSMSYGNQ